MHGVFEKKPFWILLEIAVSSLFIFWEGQLSNKSGWQKNQRILEGCPFLFFHCPLFSFLNSCSSPISQICLKTGASKKTSNSLSNSLQNHWPAALGKHLSISACKPVNKLPF